MIEEQLFKKHFVGKDSFIWWIGQVVDQSKWQDNINGRRVDSTDAIPGFGERYKVRIMGYHTHDLNALSDDELPWATVMYPVTSGGGSAGSSTSAQLRQGMFVFGFFLDGEDGQQPVIMGVLGFNQQTSLEKKIPKIGFLPFSGYTVDDKVPVTNIQTSEESKSGVQVKPPGQTQNQEKGIINSNQGATSGQKEKASDEQKKDGKLQSPMSKLTRCGRNDVKGIAVDIQKMILLVENLTKLAGDFSAELTGRIDKIQKRIKKAVDDAIVFVTSKIKNIVEAVRKSVIEKVNNVVKDTFYLFFPNLRPAVKEAHLKTLDGLSCVINKIIDGLLNLVTNALSGLVNKVVNAPACLAESVASGIMGQVAGFISGVLDSVLQPINALLQTVGAAADLAGQVLSIIKKIFGLFSCEEELSCPSLDQWSTWDGPGDNGGPSIDIESVFNQAQSIGQSAAQAATDLAGNFNALNLNVGGLGGGGIGAINSGCDVGPIQCGVPNISIFGSGGSGAVGNAVIGITGEILGVDIVNPGSGFTAEPVISITDSCGTGDGAAAIPIMAGNPNSPTGMSIQKVAVVDPGSGYLPGPDGSSGGSGRVWKKRNQTYRRGNDGTYYPPVDPGTPIQLEPGDTINVPSPIITEIGPIPGGIDHRVDQPIIITAPPPPVTIETLLNIPELQNLPTLSREQREDLINRVPQLENLSPREKEILIGLSPTFPLSSFNPSSTLETLTKTDVNGLPIYPVILELDEVYIKDTGFNYTEGDTIVMEPSNGAVVKPIIRNGAVVGVNIEKTARGFNERPRIYVDSNTGYNAELIPVFRVIEVSPEDEIPPGTNVISVVDCVGKHSM